MGVRLPAPRRFAARARPALAGIACGGFTMVRGGLRKKGPAVRPRTVAVRRQKGVRKMKKTACGIKR